MYSRAVSVRLSWCGPLHFRFRLFSIPLSHLHTSLYTSLLPYADSLLDTLTMFVGRLASGEETGETHGDEPHEPLRESGGEESGELPERLPERRRPLGGVGFLTPPLLLPAPPGMMTLPGRPPNTCARWHERIK